MLATCVRMEYQPAESSVDASYSRKAPQIMRAHRAQGGYVKDLGTGWAVFATSSKLILHIMVDGKSAQIWVDRFFRHHLGILTQKRRQRIASAMPTTISVLERVGRKGTHYWSVPESELMLWLTTIKASL